MSTRAQQESKQDLAGQRLGDYELLMRLASGGMGAVYVARAARHGGFERLFALKTCHSFLLDDPAFLPMFLDEARLAALVRHPNVVATVDVGEANHIPFLVMEYVEGVSLSMLLRQAGEARRRVATSLVLRVVIDALHGLHATHEACDLSGQPLGLVHRDVSPHNLIVGRDGTTRLADFGVAKAASRSASTRDGTLKGKFAYIAPEALRLEPVDHRADLFAMGVVLWESLENKRLFFGPSDPETLQRVLHLPVPPLEMREGISPELQAIVTRALDRDPEKRFASAAEMAQALERLRAAANASEVSLAIETLFGPALSATRQELSASIRKRAESPDARPEPTPTPTPTPKRASRAPQIALGLAVLIAATSIAGATYILTRNAASSDTATITPQANIAPVVAVPVPSLPAVPPPQATEEPSEGPEPAAQALAIEPTSAPEAEPRRPRARLPRETRVRRPDEFRPTEL